MATMDPVRYEVLSGTLIESLETDAVLLSLRVDELVGQAPIGDPETVELRFPLPLAKRLVGVLGHLTDPTLPPPDFEIPGQHEF